MRCRRRSSIRIYVWFDRATEKLFRSVQLPLAELRRQFQIVGMPLLESRDEYQNACLHGAELQLESRVESWSGRTFTVQHRVTHADGRPALCGWSGRGRRRRARRRAGHRAGGNHARLGECETRSSHNAVPRRIVTACWRRIFRRGGAGGAGAGGSADLAGAAARTQRPRAGARRRARRADRRGVRGGACAWGAQPAARPDRRADP